LPNIADCCPHSGDKQPVRSVRAADACYFEHWQEGSLDGIARCMRTPACDIMRDAVCDQTYIATMCVGVPRESELGLEPQPCLHAMPPSGEQSAGEASPQGRRRIDRRQSRLPSFTRPTSEAERLCD